MDEMQPNANPGGDSLVMDHFSDGLLLHLRLPGQTSLQLSTSCLMPDDSDGCRVGFASREYAAGDGGMMRDGTLVHLNRVFSAEHSNNRHAHRLHHHNRGYAQAEIMESATKKKQSTIILVNHE